MVLSIKNENLTVSVEIQENDERFTQPELLLKAALEAIGCIIGGGTVDAYYHLDPDTLELRDEEDHIWAAYSKYKLLYHEHLTEKE